MKHLELKNLTIHYLTDYGVVEAVNNISLSLEEGQTLGLVGETGAGKTTTALGIMRLVPDPPGKIMGGEIIFEGENLLDKTHAEMRKIRGEKISMIFQDPMSALNPIMKISDQITEVIRLHQRLSKADAVKKACEILEMVGINAERINDYPHQFSGGMKQRAIIAIALACRPSLIIADEPTTALDVTIQAQVIDMIEKLKTDLNTSMLLITHDMGIVAETCDFVAIMYAGEIVEYGSLEDIFNKTSHPYTQGLFGSIPNLEEESERLKPIDGLMPDPMNLPIGCSFNPRCPECMEVCRQSKIEPIELTPGHFVRCHLFAM